MRCPGKLVLERGKTDAGNKYAAWGTVAHDIAATCLQNPLANWPELGTLFSADGFEIEFDAEMRDMIEAYVVYVNSLQGTDGELMVEEQVNYSTYLGVPTDEGWGTADAIVVKGKDLIGVNYSAHLGVSTDEGWGTADAIVVKSKDLIVVDLKTGRGEAIDAAHNEQMSLYALGAMSMLEDVFGEFDNVTLCIFQPRVGRPSEWTVKASELKQWANSTARSAASSVRIAFLNKGDPEFDKTFLRPGEKQCRWCKAAATCPALRADVAHTALGVEPATPDEFEAYAEGMLTDLELDREDEKWLAASLSKVDLIEGWCTAVRAEVERRLLAGKPIPGYKLVQGKRGNRAWGSESEAEAMLKTFRLKTEEMYKLKLISPTDAEKLAKAETIGKRQWPKLQALITQADGKPHVAPASDSRPPLAVKPAADDFADESASDIC